MTITQDYRRAVDVLREGGIVALPTDTVYGLVAVAADAAAVERVYDAKGRDPLQAMPVFVGSIEQCELIAEMNGPARRLAERFWPGALTIVLRRKTRFATRAASGGETIGVRMPADPVIRELALQLGPLTGTSANRSGAAECRTAGEVEQQLDGRVDLIVDAPAASIAKPSTVVDCSDGSGVRILREGAITRAAVAEALDSSVPLDE